MPPQAVERDGNFVLYDTFGRPLWVSHTSRHPEAYVTLQDDGNLVLYDHRHNPALGQPYIRVTRLTEFADRAQ